MAPALEPFIDKGDFPGMQSEGGWAPEILYDLILKRDLSGMAEEFLDCWRRQRCPSEQDGWQRNAHQ